MIRRLLVLVGGLLGAGLLLAAPALAHASVVSSNPADGSRLKSAPHTVTITFDEGVGIGTGLGYLHVTDQNGRAVDAGPAFHPAGDAAQVADTLKGGLGDGSYTASYRVISADSHPVAGSIAFVVGNGALVHGTESVSATNSTTAAAFDVVRWISYAGIALLGGSWLLLTIWPAGRDDRRARGLVWTGWGAAAAAAVLAVLVQGAYGAGSGLSKIADWTLLDATLHTDYGELACTRLVALGLLALVFARSLQPGARPARWEQVAGVLGIVIAATFAGTGHAASTSPNWISMPSDALHVLAMAAWLGGLVMLLVAVLPRREPDELSAVLPVFSRVAFVSVAVLGITGTYAALRGIGTLNAVFTTTYGLLVLGKVALFLGLLAVGNLSRLLVRRRTVAYAMTDTLELPSDVPVSDATVERLRRSVFVEVLIGIVVLAVTAVLVNEPRGKEALVASYRSPIAVSASLGGGQTVRVAGSTGEHGPVDITVTLGGGATAQSVTATATQIARQIGPLPVALRRQSATSFDGTVTLPVGGSWDIDLVVTASPLDATTTDVTLHIH